ncbi:MAG: CRISPR-associated endonuclease Cas1 [Erythrobacter sp.]
MGVNPQPGCCHHAQAWASNRAQALLIAGRNLGLRPAENRNASHPVNAMLNYAYAVKLAKVQIEAIAEGYDLTSGIMHNSKRGSHAWALDMIELERSAVDAKILQFVREHAFAPDDFILRKDGCCRLAPQLARVVAGLL